MPAQLVALTNSLLAYAENIDKLSVVEATITRICEKHVSRAVLPVHYGAVGECYLAAMQEELGEAATPEIVTAWALAFGVLAGMYIDREEQMRKEWEERAGYSGFVKMTVLKVEDAPKGAKSLSLKPVDYGVPKHEKGQFVSLLVEKHGEEPTTTSMNISDNETDSMTISVPQSKERSSRYLLEEVNVGDHLNVSIPCGKCSS